MLCYVLDICPSAFLRSLARLGMPCVSYHRSWRRRTTFKKAIICNGRGVNVATTSRIVLPGASLSLSLLEGGDGEVFACWLDGSTWMMNLTHSFHMYCMVSSIFEVGKLSCAFGRASWPSGVVDYMIRSLRCLRDTSRVRMNASRRKRAHESFYRPGRTIPSSFILLHSLSTLLPFCPLILEAYTDPPLSILQSPPSAQPTSPSSPTQKTTGATPTSP